MGQFEVFTKKPIAYESVDHIIPHGTKNDNSRNGAFNQKLYKLYPNRQIRVMDLGCAGGGFVKDCLDDGHISIGIEGSDYSRNNKRAEWATIPQNLFTADITEPFQVREGGRHVRFDVVTAWEVMEHIPEEKLDAVFGNILWHLQPEGLILLSISNTAEIWHACVHPRDWWVNRLNSFGLVAISELRSYFGRNWVRGPGTHSDNEQFFNLALKQKEAV